MRLPDRASVVGAAAVAAHGWLSHHPAVVVEDAARAANDNARLNQLAAEANHLQAYFQSVQPRALALPEVQAARQVYLQRLFAKMTELDPQAQTYVDRLTQLRSAGTTGGAK